ncbi:MULTISPECIES: tetratricopeptide repeat protein [unclassified Chryseobacterium]|uniref:tetratricopeptide repeat protein n=1 Tax=unclassified Chryseobacterium TaxID=2593645 RepID=UPI00301ACE1A
MKSIFSLLLLLCAFFAFGQKEDSVAYEKIMQAEDDFIENIENGKQDSANVKFKHLFEQYDTFLLKFPVSDYTFSILGGKASAQYTLKNYDQAKKSYLQLLNYFKQNKNLKDPFVRIPYSEDNQFLYELYKKLAYLEMIQKNYREAIEYLNLAQSNPVRISCGNGLFSEIAYIAHLYSECYSNLHEDEKICDVLIPIAAIPMVHENSPTVTMLYETLSKKYTKKELKKLFKESFKTLYSKQGVINTIENTIYYVKFMDRDVILYDLNFKNLSKRDTKKRLNKILHFSKFYTLLSK